MKSKQAASGDLNSSNGVLFAFETLVMCSATIRLHVHTIGNALGTLRTFVRVVVDISFKCVYENAIKPSDGLRSCYWCCFSAPFSHGKILFVPFHFNSSWQLSVEVVSQSACLRVCALTNKTISNGCMLNTRRRSHRILQ